MAMLPRVIVHALISLDGKMEGFAPEAVGLYYQLAGRLECDTWLVGSETILATAEPLGPADEAEAVLPAIRSGAGPLLIVPDSRGRIKGWSALVEALGVRGVVVLVARDSPPEVVRYLDRRRIAWIESGAEWVDYRQAFAELAARYGCRAIQSDSGGVLNNLLLGAGLVDELSLVVVPVLAGDPARGMYRSLDLTEPIELTLLALEPLENGAVWLRYAVRGGDKPNRPSDQL